MSSDWIKCGLCIGAGVAVGAMGAMLISRNPEAIKKGCTTLLSHAMDLKEKAAAAAETARENMEDLAAEAKHDFEARKKNTAPESEA